MVCIYCGHDTKVTNSRERARNPSVWRRRACKSCVAQFTTIELPDYDSSFVIKGSNGRLYPFSRDKLFLSLYKSLGHRSDALKSTTGLTETVIGRILYGKRNDKSVISVGVLAKSSYQVLKRFDPLSAHTYKAYHQTALKAVDVR